MCRACRGEANLSRTAARLPCMCAVTTGDGGGLLRHQARALHTRTL